MLHENSFATHSKSKFWSNRNEGKPEDYALNSHQKCWFDCECGHEFDSSCLNLNQANTWCPYCSNKKLCDDTNCKKCFDKCFEEPFEVFKNSHKKYWFDCECGHNFETSLRLISFDNCWCPYCANRILCNETEKCNSCHNKSFSSIDRSKNWSTKNKKKPIEVFKSTAEQF